eukprot:TRINITY_DN857_c0_g1_i1.p1 TRINITY_DN857_c0_g1~~TRINITY_DN857_c0_g1_i1.p1  ORF type:complete len:143 (+),score=26.26 TRINITY_DN857_c0_g1_i1:53-430(+)
MNHLKRLGVVDYLDKIVKCERRVLSALFLYSNLHSAVFTIDERTNPEHVLMVNRSDRRGCNLLYTPDSQHNVRFSRYPPYGRSGGVKEVKPSTFFAVTGQNDQQQKEYKQQLEGVERQIGEAQQD